MHIMHVTIHRNKLFAYEKEYIQAIALNIQFVGLLYIPTVLYNTNVGMFIQTGDAASHILANARFIHYETTYRPDKRSKENNPDDFDLTRRIQLLK